MKTLAVIMEEVVRDLGGAMEAVLRQELGMSKVDMQQRGAETRQEVMMHQGSMDEAERYAQGLMMGGLPPDQVVTLLAEALRRKR